jgi:hypothetical protein
LWSELYSITKSFASFFSYSNKKPDF